MVYLHHALCIFSYVKVDEIDSAVMLDVLPFWGQEEGEGGLGDVVELWVSSLPASALSLESLWSCCQLARRMG